MDKQMILSATGRELDALVEEAKGQRTLSLRGGATLLRTTPNGEYIMGMGEVPNYHSNWAHAGPLLEEIIDYGYLGKCGSLWCWHFFDGDDVLSETPLECIVQAYCLWKLERGKS